MPLLNRWPRWRPARPALPNAREHQAVIAYPHGTCRRTCTCSFLLKPRQPRGCLSCSAMSWFADNNKITTQRARVFRSRPTVPAFLSTAAQCESRESTLLPSCIVDRGPVALGGALRALRASASHGTATAARPGALPRALLRPWRRGRGSRARAGGGGALWAPVPRGAEEKSDVVKQTAGKMGLMPSLWAAAAAAAASPLLCVAVPRAGRARDAHDEPNRYDSWPGRGRHA